MLFTKTILYNPYISNILLLNANKKTKQKKKTYKIFEVNKLKKKDKVNELNRK